jgi:hypothetical protein
MLFQAYTHDLPTIVYYVALSLFVGAVVSSVALGNEFLAVTGVLSFFLVIRLMFYVSTLFLVFPFGDPYGQFGVLRAFAQSSHISILFPDVGIFDRTNYLAVVSNQYSQWPGLQIFTLILANVVGLPLLDAALAMTIILDLGWFASSYCLVRKILGRAGFKNLQNPVPLCLALVTSLPTTEMPSFFKYDFPATIFLLVSLILLLRILDNRDLRASFPLLVLSLAITVTHSITAFAWIILLLPFAVLTGVPSFSKVLSSYLRPLIGQRLQWLNTRRDYPPLHRLFAFALTAFLSWSAFYAVYLGKYATVSSRKILASLSIGALSSSRLAPNQSSFAVLTPTWVLDMLLIRDRVLLVLLLVGIAGVILLPTLVGRVHAKILLITVAVISLLTELSGALSFGDRALVLFAPLLGVLVMGWLGLIALPAPRLSRVASLFLIALFLFAAGIGFWASSYAPTSLYAQGADPSLASGRPLVWPAVASYLSFSGRQNCILTNEIYATSLAVPVEEWNITKLVGNVAVNPGCLAIVYPGLFSAVNANVSSYGFGEPYFPYNGFSASAFYASLSTNTSDRVFSAGNVVVYYHL